MTLVVDDTDPLVFMLCRVVVTNCTGQGDIECLWYQRTQANTRRSRLYLYIVSPYLKHKRPQSIGDHREVRFPKNYQERKGKESKVIHQSEDVDETKGCSAMVGLLNANQNDSLVYSRYNMLYKTVTIAKAFVTPEFHQPPRSVKCTPCKLTSRLWSGWGVTMKWSGLSGDRVRREAWKMCVRKNSA